MMCFPSLLKITATVSSVFVLDATGGADDGDCVQKASVYKSHSSDMTYQDVLMVNSSKNDEERKG